MHGRRTMQCPACHANLRDLVKGPYHSGFSNVAALYCDTCAKTLVIGSYDPKYQALTPGKQPWCLSEDEKLRVENHIKPCSCGGRFRFGAFPRCPVCLASISALLPDSIHFLVLPDSLDAERCDKVWMEPPSQQ